MPGIFRRKLKGVAVFPGRRFLCYNPVFRS
jgi:hypothetical protein